MTGPPPPDAPFELFPPDEGELERVWVKAHARMKGGRYVKVPGHWRRKG